MDSREKKRRASIKRLCRTGEAAFAHNIAEKIRLGLYATAGAMKGDSPHLHRQVADALDDKFEPSPTRLNIVAAWYQGTLRAMRADGGCDAFAKPSVADIKKEFVRLFGQTKLPADFTIRKTLQRLNLSYAPGKVGAPKKLAPK